MTSPTIGGDDRRFAGPPEDGRDPVEALVEEYFARSRRGEAVDIDAFARRAAGREPEFRKLIRALGALEAAAKPARTTLASFAPQERLGRFRLVRLIGRGGMGAVFEAVDEELARHVALKILPGHATLERREVERFHREAQAAARLRHPHIVPVFGVGESDGTHWLAMQLIPGESLDRVLRRAPAPDAGGSQRPARMDPREVARHGLAIAEALACAHAEGVLHRDVKPSNLLLDTSGVVWVTDFGLAKSEGTATLTRTGETVGTPRYMAPEAFNGWADPRTDVWGVGATLYELLSGRPAFDGADRARLLKQISDVDPTPLRRLDPTLPRDLATIVHKCLHKEPAARYGSAQELADDLRRYLAGEPIRARPPSLAYRASLLGRRHPTATALLFVALAGGVVMTSLEAARARTAEAQSKRRFDDVRQLAGSFLFEFHDAIRNLPGSTAARALVVRRGLEYLDRLSAESADDAALRRELSLAYQKVGDVQGNPYQPNLGDLAGARKSYRKSIDLLEPVVASGQATAEDLAALASAWLVGGGIELVGGTPGDAVAMSRKGLALRKDLADREPTVARRRDLAVAWQYTAFSLVGNGREEEARVALDEQAAILRELLRAQPDDPGLERNWGQNRFLMAQHLARRQEAEAARTCYDEAVGVQRRLLAGDPRNTSLRRDLAWTLNDAAGLLDQIGRDGEALATYSEVLAIDESLEKDDSGNQDARIAVALAHNNVAWEQLKLGHLAEAREHAGKAIERGEKLMAADPANSFVRSVLAMACANVADADFATGDLASLHSARELYRKSIALLESQKSGDRETGENRARLETVRAKLAACEAKLAR